MNRPVLFLADLDGTLLNSQKRVTEVTRNALAAFLARGNYFAISTGRPFDSARKILNTLDLEESRCFVASFNGAQVHTADGQLIFNAGVPAERAGEIIRLGRERGVYIHTYDQYGILSDQEGEQLAYYQYHTPLPAHVVKDVTASIRTAPGKLIAIELQSPEKLEQLQEWIDRAYPDLKAKRSEKTLLEIFSAEAGKDTAMQRLCSYLQIPQTNTAAAGDAANDADMIRAAGVGIVMKNGQEPVKALADIITREDNDHDGLAEYLNRDLGIGE